MLLTACGGAVFRCKQQQWLTCCWLHEVVQFSDANSSSGWHVADCMRWCAVFRCKQQQWCTVFSCKQQQWLTCCWLHVVVLFFQIQTAAVVTIPLKGTVECQARNPAEDKLLLGCSDASLVCTGLSGLWAVTLRWCRSGGVGCMQFCLCGSSLVWMCVSSWGEKQQQVLYYIHDVCVCIHVYMHVCVCAVMLVW